MKHCDQLQQLSLAVASRSLNCLLQDSRRRWLSDSTSVPLHLLVLSVGEEAGECLHKAVAARPRLEVCHTWAGKCLLSLPVKLLHDGDFSDIQRHWLA